MFNPEEEDMEEFDGDFEKLDGTLDVTMEDPQQTRVLEVGDLVSKDFDIGLGGQVRVADVIPFIVLKFDPAVDKSWSIPTPELFDELINRVAGMCTEYNIKCYRAYRWATLWGKVGLLGLSSKDLKDIQDYREVIEDQRSGQVKFTIFPKDALERRGNLSVLMRANLKSFDHKWLPKAILMRGRLKGGLRLTHVKYYREDDRTRDGVSKCGWRLALLQGCPQFMEDLKRFDQDHRFPVGAGHVILRGGPGRPKGTVERNRGSRGGGPRQQGQQHDQQPDQQQRQHQSSTARREERGEDDYERNFPSWGRDRERERERDRSAGGRGGSRGHAASGAWGKNGPRNRYSDR